MASISAPEKRILSYLTPHLLFLKLLLSFCIAAALAGCDSLTMNKPARSQNPAGRIANPASVNCIRQGGVLSIRKRGDGGEYGVCIFASGRQCEEWAMFYGECPAGGIDIKGYITQAARYCAITGGKYDVIGNADTSQEKGTCLFKNGRSCDALDYFSGRCSPMLK